MFVCIYVVSKTNKDTDITVTFTGVMRQGTANRYSPARNPL